MKLYKKDKVCNSNLRIVNLSIPEFIFFSFFQKLFELFSRLSVQINVAVNFLPFQGKEANYHLRTF